MLGSLDRNLCVDDWLDTASCRRRISQRCSRSGPDLAQSTFSFVSRCNARAACWKPPTYRSRKSQSGWGSTIRSISRAVSTGSMAVRPPNTASSTQAELEARRSSRSPSPARACLAGSSTASIADKNLFRQRRQFAFVHVGRPTPRAPARRCWMTTAITRSAPCAMSCQKEFTSRMISPFAARRAARPRRSCRQWFPCRPALSSRQARPP